MHQDSHLIFDCGFESEMTPYEARNAAEQMVRSFAANRSHCNPFFFHFVNLKPGGDMHEAFLRKLPTIEKPSLPIRLSNNEWPENISKERLVYLTPDSPNELLQFNHNDVYIIGAIVDKRAKKPLTLAKAKCHDIRTAKLPLDRAMQWKQSNKVLTLDQITKIMLDYKTSGDYKTALKHVPDRKVLFRRK